MNSYTRGGLKLKLKGPTDVEQIMEVIRRELTFIETTLGADYLYSATLFIQANKDGERQVFHTHDLTEISGISVKPGSTHGSILEENGVSMGSAEDLDTKIQAEDDYRRTEAQKKWQGIKEQQALKRISDWFEAYKKGEKLDLEIADMAKEAKNSATESTRNYIMREFPENGASLLTHFDEWAAKPGYKETTQSALRALRQSICEELEIESWDINKFITNTGAIKTANGVARYLDDDTPPPKLPCYRVTYKDTQSGRAAEAYIFDRNLRLVAIKNLRMLEI